MKVMELNFNKNWTITGKDGVRKMIDLPYDAMIHEKREADAINGVNSGYFPGGKYRYEKAFSLTGEQCTGKKLFLHFECVYRNCVITVNGKEVCRHRYGYTCFDADITDAVHPEENTVVVDMDNSLEPNCRWYSGSGIFRDVTLVVKDEDYISRFQVRTVSVDPPVIHVDAKTAKDSPVTIRVMEGDNVLAEGVPGEITVPGAGLWSEEDPRLYTVKAVSERDERSIRFGIRTLRWNSREGLLVNGKSVLLRGGCIHHDHGVIGANEYRDSEYRRIRILKENGFNAIRMAHNPASQITLDVCDELGMYVMDEVFDGWYIPKTYHDYSRDFEDHWREDIQALVASAYSHPSVIMYSAGNEVSETASEKGVRVCGELKRYLNTLDDTRPVTAGINVLINVYANMGLGIYRETKTYEPVPLEKKKGYREKKTGSAFFNAMAQKLGKIMFYTSKGKKGDRASRGAGEQLDILGLNYASSRYDEDAARYPDRMMVGSETMVGDLPYNWERVKRYPQLVGDFVWSAWDYLGEACIGDWTYASYKGLPLLAGQGMIDITGKPLAAMYFMQIVWGLRKEPFIGLRPLNHWNETPDTGACQFTNAIDSYTWEGYEGKKAYAEVYGADHAVSLFLNGKKIGTKDYKDYKAAFTFPYEPGELKAASLDRDGKVVSETVLRTGEKETVITATPDRDSLRAGTDDLAYVTIEFTDPEGNLKPYIEIPVEIIAEGPVSLLGFGSALCKSDETFDGNIHTSYRGRCLAVLKAGEQAGSAKITVKANGYKTITKEIKVVQK